MMRKTKEILADLDSHFSSDVKRHRLFSNFVYKIRFPVYKNIERNAEINFDHPMTIFVGQNGCGKSSALQALSGAPRNTSVGNFWFSTKLDPIQEGKGKPNCFIYTYYNDRAQKKVEIIKTRVRYKKTISGKTKVDPDYWEPKRASKEYGMILPQVVNDVPEPGAEKSERWTVPKINIIYIDFRSELSAFDQYFYFGEKPNNLKRYTTKQDRLRAWTKNKLSLLFNGTEKFILDRSGQKHNKKPLIELSQIEIDFISEILSKKYTKCRMVEHNCFGSPGYSVQFEVSNKAYTEAFAGSGEMAVVRVVHLVLNAPKKSLILLDEPEVSLHPGAQKKLRDFLLEQSLSSGHQIVICSHSPIFLEQLSAKSIKVFVPNSDGTFRVVENVSRNDAFIQIGHTVDNKKHILVEDSAAKYLIEKALSYLGVEYEDLFEVNFYPGGETSIFKDLVVHSRENKLNQYVIFDGDIYKEPWLKSEEISELELDATIAKFCAQSVDSLNFRFDGGSDQEQLAKRSSIKRHYLTYISERCFFLPTHTPEEIIWEAFNLENKEVFERGIPVSDKARFKKYLGLYVADQVDMDNSDSRKVIIRQILKKQFDEENEKFKALLTIIRKLKALHDV
jgi:predicted ATPase